MATRTISAAGGTRAWSDTATWDEGVVPTAADDVVARGDGTSGNVTIAAAASCRSAVFTNYVGVLTHNAAVNWNIGTSSKVASNDSLKFVPGMTYTPLDAATSRIIFASTTTGCLVTFAGKLVGRVSFAGVGGGWTLQDDCTNVSPTTSGASFDQSAGTLNTNGKTITASAFANTNGGTRSCVFDGSTFNLNGPGGTVLNVTTATALTWSAAGTVWNLLTSGATSTISAPGLALGTVNWSAGTAGTLTISGGANTLALVGSGSPLTLTLPAGVTTTFTAVPTLNGTATRRLAVVSSTAGTAATVSVASGKFAGTYMSVKDIAFTGGAEFHAKRSYVTSNVSGLVLDSQNQRTLLGVG